MKATCISGSGSPKRAIIRVVRTNTLACLLIPMCAILGTGCTSSEREAARSAQATKADQKSGSHSLEGIKELIYACEQENASKVQALLAQGVNPNGTDDNGATPLMFAVRKGSSGIVRMLIQRGASVNSNSRQNDGFTPLIIAAMFNKYDLVPLLVSAGAHVDDRSLTGSTPLHYASMKGYSQVVSELVKSGAKVDLRNNEGATPLHFAAQNGHAEIVKQLIKAGANVNPVGSNGATPLISATFNGHTAVVELLLTSGADVNIRDASGRTAADYARQRDFPKITQVLESRSVAMPSSASPRRIVTDKSDASDNIRVPVVRHIGNIPVFADGTAFNPTITEIGKLKGATVEGDGWTMEIFKREEAGRHLPVIFTKTTIEGEVVPGVETRVIPSVARADVPMGVSGYNQVLAIAKDVSLSVHGTLFKRADIYIRTPLSPETMNKLESAALVHTQDQESYFVDLREPDVGTRLTRDFAGLNDPCFATHADSVMQNMDLKTLFGLGSASEATVQQKQEAKAGWKVTGDLSCLSMSVYVDGRRDPGKKTDLLLNVAGQGTEFAREELRDLVMNVLNIAGKGTDFTSRDKNGGATPLSLGFALGPGVTIMSLGPSTAGATGHVTGTVREADPASRVVLIEFDEGSTVGTQLAKAQLKCPAMSTDRPLLRFRVADKPSVEWNVLTPGSRVAFDCRELIDHSVEVTNLKQAATEATPLIKPPTVTPAENPRQSSQTGKRADTEIRELTPAVSKIAVGMSRNQVLEALGKPDFTEQVLLGADIKETWLYLATGTTPRIALEFDGKGLLKHIQFTDQPLSTQAISDAETAERDLVARITQAAGKGIYAIADIRPMGTSKDVGVICIGGRGSLPIAKDSRERPGDGVVLQSIRPVERGADINVAKGRGALSLKKNGQADFLMFEVGATWQELPSLIADGKFDLLQGVAFVPGVRLGALYPGDANLVFDYVKAGNQIVHFPGGTAGSVHRLVGEIRIGAWTFAGEEDILNPLTFLLTNEGYIYVRGKGTVTLPSGEIVRLPPTRGLKEKSGVRGVAAYSVAGHKVSRVGPNYQGRKLRWALMRAPRPMMYPVRLLAKQILHGLEGRMPGLAIYDLEDLVLDLRRLTLVQMVDDKNAIRLLASDSIEYPEAIKPGSASWQIWAAEVIAKSVAHGPFQGKKAIAAMPAREVFIDIIKIPKAPEGDLQNAILNYLKPKLGLAPDNILMEHFKTDSENILVMATDKTMLYRHLAIYEKAHLKIASISVWPLAVLKAYARLWATHKDNNDNPVMLLDIGKSCTNIVVCDSAKLYFARSAPVGAKNLETDRMVDLLNSEMDMCRIRFRSLYKKPQVNHIIFTSGHTVDKDIYTRIAKRARMSAQIGDCLDTVKATRPEPASPANHAPYATWMTAMGLSLS